MGEIDRKLVFQITESSKCLCRRVFPHSIKWAGRSARYDRRVRNAEAAGSNPARSIVQSEPCTIQIP
jgi:hypothetical protein